MNLRGKSKWFKGTRIQDFKVKKAYTIWLCVQKRIKQYQVPEGSSFQKPKHAAEQK
jgi:hypothetical protein